MGEKDGHKSTNSNPHLLVKAAEPSVGPRQVCVLIWEGRDVETMASVDREGVVPGLGLGLEASAEDRSQKITARAQPGQIQTVSLCTRKRLFQRDADSEEVSRQGGSSTTDLTRQAPGKPSRCQHWAGLHKAKQHHSCQGPGLPELGSAPCLQAPATFCPSDKSSIFHVHEHFLR